MALVFDDRVEKRLGRVIKRRVKGTFGRQLTKNPDWKLDVVGAPQCRHQCCPDGAVTDEIAMTEAEWAQHNAIVVDKENQLTIRAFPWSPRLSCMRQERTLRGSKRARLYRARTGDQGARELGPALARTFLVFASRSINSINLRLDDNQVACFQIHCMSTAHYHMPIYDISGRAIREKKKKIERSKLNSRVQPQQTVVLCQPLLLNMELETIRGPPRLPEGR